VGVRGYAGAGGHLLRVAVRAKPPAEPRFSGGILLDNLVRERLRAGTPGGRATAGHVSDAFWWGGTAIPLLVDVPVALLAHDNTEVAGQLAMMDLEAFAVAGVVNRSMELTLGRGRPGAIAAAAPTPRSTPAALPTAPSACPAATP
jgi:hypothetical protein